MNAAELLPLLRELFSRNTEYRGHEPWELVWLLFSLRYTNELEPEAEIAAAAAVARSDWTGAAARLKEWGAAVVAGVAVLVFCGVAAFLGWEMWR
jgi:hypothetical protein